MVQLDRLGWAGGLSVLVTSVAAAQPSEEGEALTFLEMFFLSGDVVGLTIVWGLLLMSLLGFGLMLKLAMQYRRLVLLPPETRRDVQALLTEHRYAEAIDYARGDASYLGRLTAAALSEAGRGYAAMERAVEETGDAETTRLLRPIEYLNVLGNIAPMLGLFGTVYGMIVAFQQLVASGGSADPVNLAGGISTALVTTFWGLVVAIPALAAYALIRNKVDALTSEGILIVEELIEPFKPGGKLAGESAGKDGGGMVTSSGIQSAQFGS